MSKSSKKNGRDPYPSKHEVFRKIAAHTAHGVGHPGAFAAALTLILVWAVTGPIFGFSDTWQLVVNTGTTIVTFLMVFLIQNTQNRDSHAIHLKLDELIRANEQARNALLCAEELTDEELDDLQEEFARLAKERIAQRRQSQDDEVDEDDESSGTTSSRLICSRSRAKSRGSAPGTA